MNNFEQIAVLFLIDDFTQYEFLIKLDLRQTTFRFWWWLGILPSLLAFVLIYGGHRALESQLGGELREGMPIYISNLDTLEELRGALDLDLSFQLVNMPEDSALIAVQEGRLEAAIVAQQSEDSLANIQLEIYVDSYTYGDTWEHLQVHLQRFERGELQKRLSILGLESSSIQPVQTNVLDFGQAKQLDVLSQLPMLISIGLSLLFLGLIGRSIYFFSVLYEKRNLGSVQFRVPILTLLAVLQFTIFWIALSIIIQNLPNNSLLKPFMTKVFAWGSFGALALLTLSLSLFLVTFYQWIIQFLPSIDTFRRGLFNFWLLFFVLVLLLLETSVEIATWEAFIPVWSYLREAAYLFSGEELGVYYFISIGAHLGIGTLFYYLTKRNK